MSTFQPPPQQLECEGLCENFGGCSGPVRTVVVSRMGERDLCQYAIGGFIGAGYVVSDIYADAYAGENNRQAPDEDVLRALGHFLK
jgi:hypothetical protein